MEEEFRANIDGGGGSCGGVGAGSGGRVVEWEVGLPSGADLTPLYQLLIPQRLASAFQISPPHKSPSAADVDRASVTTFSSIQNGDGAHAPLDVDITGSDPEKSTVDDRSEAVEEEDGESTVDKKKAAARKRQRLSWTPELQRRFLDVVDRLGVKNAVPNTIKQMMNVEGLTRENVASHLQKYRIYLKQRQAFSSSGGATSSSSGRFSPVGLIPPMVPHSGPMTGVPDSGHNMMPRYHQHHYHHHYHHISDHAHGGTSGFRSNQYISEQKGPNDMEDESQGLSHP